MPKPPKALTRAEDRLRDRGYEVRYERGHFRAGFCVVHARRIVVVNKFFDSAARVSTLEAIAAELERDGAAAAPAIPAPQSAPAS